MPQPPKRGESEKKFVERCIPVVLNEKTAKDGSQAAAICHSMYREHKKKSHSQLIVEAVAEELLKSETIKAPSSLVDQMDDNPDDAEIKKNKKKKDEEEKKE